MECILVKFAEMDLSGVEEGGVEDVVGGSVDIGVFIQKENTFCCIIHLYRRLSGNTEISVTRSCFVFMFLYVQVMRTRKKFKLSEGKGHVQKSSLGCTVRFGLFFVF